MKPKEMRESPTMPTHRKKPSIDHQVNTAWQEYSKLPDATTESKLATNLTKLARVSCRSVPNLDDVVQDAVLKLWQRKDTYNPKKASFATWAGIVIRSVCDDSLREHMETKRRDKPLESLNAAEFNQQIVDATSHIEAQEREVGIEQALSTLSQPKRDVACLRLQGMSHAEIAEALGIPIVTARRRWERVLEELGGD